MQDVVLAGSSFHELFVRSHIKLRGFGLRSLVQSAPAAFIGAVERSVSAFSGEEGVCRELDHVLGTGGLGSSGGGRCWVQMHISHHRRVR